MHAPRKEILALNPTFTWFITSVQQTLYKPELHSEGDSVILDWEDQEATILDREHADRLNRELMEEYEKNRDPNSLRATQPSDYTDHRLVCSSKENPSDYLIDIAGALEEIRKDLNEENLLIMGDWNTPWLCQENDYAPAKQALNFLKTRVPADFNGGFMLARDALREFIPHLFWLTRCNAGLPTFYMTFTNSRVVISICKYGVLHFNFYDNKEQRSILKKLIELDFEELDRCMDPVEFDDFEGRELLL